MKMLFELGSEQVEAINAVSGDRCNPHPHVFSDRLLRPGDQAFFDVIHSFMGYRTCYYRTFNVGGVTRSQLDAYKQCREWLDNAIELVRPGMTTDQIASVWPTAQELGFPDEQSCFGLQFGHGLGVGLYEAPMISRVHSLDHPIEIEEGMVFALETYCPASDGESAARIEEEVVVTATGYRRHHEVPGRGAARLRQDVRPRRRLARTRRITRLRSEGGWDAYRIVSSSSRAAPAGSARRRAGRSRPKAGGWSSPISTRRGAEAVADSIVADGGAADSVGVDVTDRSQVQAMIQKAVDTFGELNVIFNNAGMNRPRGFMEIDEENFNQIVRVNTWGVIVCTQEAAKQMIAQGSGGKIINTGSIASRQGFWDFVPYCVAKFGTLAVTQATARGSHRARDNGERVRAGRRRHADVGRAQRGHPRDPRSARGSRPDARVRNRHADRASRLA